MLCCVVITIEPNQEGSTIHHNRIAFTPGLKGPVYEVSLGEREGAMPCVYDLDLFVHLTNAIIPNTSPRARIS